jgi:hypothetical protein
MHVTDWLVVESRVLRMIVHDEILLELRGVGPRASKRKRPRRVAKKVAQRGGMLHVRAQRPIFTSHGSASP